jgi:succinate dehydrogenase / fumarate reductase iron-sulfur subunit
MQREAFCACTNFTSCEAVCPKGISIVGIARMNRDFLKATLVAGGNLGGKG